MSTDIDMTTKPYQMTQEQWQEILTYRSRYVLKIKNRIYKVPHQYLPDGSLLEWNIYVIDIHTGSTKNFKSTDVYEIGTKENYPEYWL